MSDRRPLPQPPPARVVVGSALALFAVIAVLLAGRMALGQDPALPVPAAEVRRVQPPTPAPAAPTSLPPLVTRAS